MATRGSEPDGSPEKVELSQKNDQTASSGSPCPTCYPSLISLCESWENSAMHNYIAQQLDGCEKCGTAKIVLRNCSQELRKIIGATPPSSSKNEEEEQALKQYLAQRRTSEPSAKSNHSSPLE